jgi:hypothetical protein
MAHWVLATVAAAALAVTVFLFFAIGWGLRRSIARRRAALEGEGIVRDSGVCRVAARYRRYRGRGLYAGAAIRVGSGQLVLTSSHLHVLGVRDAEPVPRAELHRYRFAVDRERLVITTDDPVGAIGRLELRFGVPDPADWVHALEEQEQKEHSGPEA